MDIDPEKLANQATPDGEKIAGIQKDQSNVEKSLASLKEEIMKVRELNLDLILSDMYQLSKDIEDANRLLNSIGSVDQYTTLAEIENRRGTELAYVTCKGYFQSAGRDAKVAQISLHAIKDLLNRLQEKLIIHDDAGMVKNDELDSDIIDK